MAKARKVVKSVRIRKTTVNKFRAQADGDIKDLKPRTSDAMYFGPEPKFIEQPIPDKLEWRLAEAFTWYNRFYDKKEAKEFVIQYLDHCNKKADAKLMRRVPEKEFVTTYGWLARLAIRGYEFVEKHQTMMQKEITRLLSLVSKEDNDSEEPDSNKPNVQEIMRERALEASGEFEGMFDDFRMDGAKSNFTIKVVDELTKRNVLAQHVPAIISIWEKTKDEYVELSSGKDEQLNEAYSHLSKSQVKNTIKFIDLIISELNSYISLKKVKRAPRAKKAVPVEKIVAKLKYQKAFKDDKEKLDLTSISPVKLHGASEAWVYDTAKRKMHHYIADEYSKVFTVKGNTLLGFDTKDSEIKTLRKPAEQIRQLLGSKPAARKFFKDIKAVAIKPNGRFNENLIILKAF